MVIVPAGLVRPSPGGVGAAVGVRLTGLQPSGCDTNRAGPSTMRHPRHVQPKRLNRTVLSHRRGPAAQHDAARRLGVDRTTTVALLDTPEDKDLAAGAAGGGRGERRGSQGLAAHDCDEGHIV
jgi:hypothetical protein